MQIAIDYKIGACSFIAIEQIVKIERLNTKPRRYISQAQQ